MIISEAAILLACSQLVTLCLYFLLNYKELAGKVISFLAFCLMCFVLADLALFAENPLLNYLIWRFAILTPFLLFFIAFKLFVDVRKFNTFLWVPIVYAILARAIGVPMYSAENANSSTQFVFIYVLPQLIVIFYACYAAVLAFKGYRSDLIEERRQIRVVFIICVGVLLVLRGLDGFFSFTDPFLDSFTLFRLSPLPDYVFPLCLFAVTLFLNLSLSKPQGQAIQLIRSSIVAPLEPSESQLTRQPGTDKRDTALLNRLVDAMENQRLYSQTGLTITQLAESLSVQEYKLRRFINKELQFKNFNQFLNSYRITEASERLLHENTPISSIALDIGFASLSSFNTAFKSRFGVTPSEYRNRHNTRTDTSPTVV